MTTEPPLLLILGRTGDIVNALPIAKHFADIHGKPVPFMVQERYASVLTGCSYIEPVIWQKDFWHTLGEAITWAEAHYPKVINLQTGGYVGGNPWQYERKARSFCLEAYAITGLENVRDSMPLVFDRRSPEREQALVASVLGENTIPALLCNFTGISSPFPAIPSIIEQIEKWGRVFRLVDLALIKAPAFYDVLGLYDAAAGLVTIDTATLHLATASTVPYIAFIQDTKTPWYASVPRGRCVLQLGYSKGIEGEAVFHNRIGRMAAKKIVTHLWPTHQAIGDTIRRNALAAYTWSHQWWEECPVDETMTQRFVADSDTRRLPFVRDMIDRACKGKRDGHVIVFTNADSCIADDAMARTLWKLSEVSVDACYSNRRDFDKIKRPLTIHEIAMGKPYPGNDWFAFRAGWWRKWRDTYPDMLVGAEAWDCVMRLIMEETHPGKKIGFDTFVYHEVHQSPIFNDKISRVTLPTQKHNRTLAQAFLKARNIDPKPYGLA